MNNRILYNVNENIICDEYVDKIILSCKKEFPEGKDLIKLYEFFGMKIHNQCSYSRNEIEQHIVNSINNIACKGNVIDIKRELKKCRRRLFWEEPVNNVYYAINRILEESISYRNDCKNTQLDIKELEEMIRNSYYIFLLNGSRFYDIEDDKMFLYKDDIEYVEALKYVNELFGVSKSVDDGDDTVQFVFGQLEKAIIKFGVVESLECLIKELANGYSKNEQRIRINSECNYIFPLLYHLIIKSMTNKVHDETSFDVDWELIKRIATCAVILTDIKDNKGMQFIFSNTFKDYTKSLAQYSGVFDLHQYCVKGVIFLVNNIINSYESELKQKLGLSGQEIIEYIQYCLDNTQRSFDEGELFSISEELIDEKQRSFLIKMSTNRTINAKYINPINWGAVDDDSEWIVKLDNKFVFLPPVISAWGVYDKICMQLNYPHTLGEVLEQAVSELFNERFGINVYSGFFLLDECKYECDCVIIEGDYAIIIECKQKSLTRQARSGDSGKILDDIAVAYLYSQAQACRVERAIKSGGKYINIYPKECIMDAKNILNGKYSGDYKRIDVSNVSKCMRITCACGNFWILSETGIVRQVEKQFYRRKTNKVKEVDSFFEERNKLLNIYDKDCMKKIVSMNHLFLSFDKLWQIVSMTQKEKLFEVLFKMSRIQSSQNDTTNHIHFFVNV